MLLQGECEERKLIILTITLDKLNVLGLLRTSGCHCAETVIALAHFSVGLERCMICVTSFSYTHLHKQETNPFFLRHV